MTLLAIMSDPHSNLEALSRVLNDIESHGAHEIYCLGDAIGYGPQPQECCDLLREKKVVLLQGNHEQGLINIHHLCMFNQPACDALRKTREMLSEDTYQWLVSHPKSLVAHGCRMVHGIPPDNVTDYLYKYTKSMEDLFGRFTEQVCFVGHTHDLKRYAYDGRKCEKLPLAEGTTELEEGKRHLVNVGAVGQPRDGDNRAKYLLYAPDSRTATVRCIEYDIRKTADLIRERGFHRAFADRLW